MLSGILSRAKNSPLTPSPPASALALLPVPLLLLRMEMDWLAGWQAACLAGHPVMDLFEWIKTGPWLYKYPQIMCPIIVFTSTKQRSSRWFIISAIGIFTPAGNGVDHSYGEPWLHAVSETSKHRTWLDYFNGLYKVLSSNYFDLYLNVL